MNQVNLQVRAKASILRRDPALLRLHRDLVSTGIISDAEFWQSRQNLLDEFVALESQQARSVTPPPSHVTAKHPAGVKQSVSMAEQSLRYTITPSIIAEILGSNPAVKKAHAELVTSKSSSVLISDVDFWKAYFTSRFFDPGLSADPKNPLNRYFEVEAEKRKRPLETDDAEANSGIKHLIAADSDLFFSSDSFSEHEDDPTVYSRPLSDSNKTSKALEIISKYNTQSMLALKKLFPSGTIPKSHHEELLKDELASIVAHPSEENESVSEDSFKPSLDLFLPVQDSREDMQVDIPHYDHDFAKLSESIRTCRPRSLTYQEYKEQVTPLIEKEFIPKPLDLPNHLLRPCNRRNSLWIDHLTRTLRCLMT